MEHTYDPIKIQSLFKNYILNSNEMIWIDNFIMTMGYEPTFSYEVTDTQTFHEFVDKELEHAKEIVNDQVSALERKHSDLFGYISKIK